MTTQEQPRHGTFPDGASVLRLVGAVLAETHDECMIVERVCSESHPFMSLSEAERRQFKEAMARLP
jgi:hypothetical protein